MSTGLCESDPLAEPLVLPPTEFLWPFSVPSLDAAPPGLPMVAAQEPPVAYPGYPDPGLEASPLPLGRPSSAGASPAGAVPPGWPPNLPLPSGPLAYPGSTLLPSGDLSLFSPALATPAPGPPASCFDDLGQALYDLREPEWIVEGLLVKGGFIILAGKPKTGKKTLISMHMALALAQGQPLFGLPVKPGLRVMMMNLEDGRQRVLRRFYDYGVRPGEALPIKIFRDDRHYLEAIEEVKTLRPDVLILDPLLEIELVYNVRNENDATEMGRVLSTIRELAHKYNILVILLHHFGTKEDRARGSSTLAGTPDGWINSRFLYKQGCYRLSWTLRDALEGYVDLAIRYEPQSIHVELVSAPVFGTTGEATEDKRAETNSEDGEEVTSRKQVAIVRVIMEATAKGQFLTKEQIRQLAQVRRDAASAIMAQLEVDGQIEKVPCQGGAKWRWRDDPAATAGGLRDESQLSRSAQAFADREERECEEN